MVKRHIFSSGAQKQPEKLRHFLPITFRLSDEKDRLYDPNGQENVLFAARKRIVSDWAKNAPLLHLNYRDTRTVMIQNAHGIRLSERFGGEEACVIE